MPTSTTPASLTWKGEPLVLTFDVQRLCWAEKRSGRPFHIMLENLKNGVSLTDVAAFIATGAPKEGYGHDLFHDSWTEQIIAENGIETIMAALSVALGDFLARMSNRQAEAA